MSQAILINANFVHYHTHMVNALLLINFVNDAGAKTIFKQFASQTSSS